jgi:hypothetical protein
MMSEEIVRGEPIYEFVCVGMKCIGREQREEVSAEKIGYQGTLADGSFELFEEKDCDWSWENIADIFCEEDKPLEIGDIYYQLDITRWIQLFERDGSFLDLECSGGCTYPSDTLWVEGGGGKVIPVPSEVNKAIERLKLECLKEHNK